MKSFYILLFVFLYIFKIYAQNINVLATGEMHGVLSNCNCEENPGGGLASISNIFKSFKNENTLLVDAGGFSAGGIYDLNSNGSECDSIKTSLMIEALSIAGYDAIGIGDDELQYNPLWLNLLANQYKINLISANILNKDSTYIFNRYVIIEKENVKFLITSLVTNEKVLSYSSEFIISDPLKELNDLLEFVKEDWDHLVILSHLGESNSRLIFNNQNNFNVLVVNGHKKIITEPGEINGKNALIQFGFQGKAVSKIEINNNSKSWEKLSWIKNEGEFKQNELIRGLEVIYDSISLNTKKDVYDLYLMSHCPYGLPVLNKLHEFLTKQYVPNELNVWFIGDVDSANVFHSLHGDNEINDELLWLYLKNQYNEYWDIFISLISSGEFTTSEVLEELKIDISKFEQWKNEEGYNILKMHYDRSNKLNINASPTLYVNNKPFEGEMDPNFIRAKECYKKKTNLLNCDSLPECFIDNDCIKKGHTGKCFKDSSNWGTCTFEKGIVFDFKILTSEDLIFKVDNDMIKTTKSMFPGANIKKLTSKDKEYKTLIKKFDVKTLPFAIFSKKVRDAFNFEKIEEGIMTKHDSFIFKNNYVPGTFLITRKKITKKIEIFIDIDKIDLHLNEIFKNLINQIDMAKINIYPLFKDDLTGEYRLDLDLTNYKIKSKINQSINKQFINLINNVDSNKSETINIEAISLYYNDYMNTYFDVIDNNKKSILFLINNQEVASPYNHKEVDVILSKIISIVK